MGKYCFLNGKIDVPLTNWKMGYQLNDNKKKFDFTQNTDIILCLVYTKEINKKKENKTYWTVHSLYIHSIYYLFGMMWINKTL